MVSANCTALYGIAGILLKARKKLSFHFPWPSMMAIDDDPQSCVAKPWGPGQMAQREPFCGAKKTAVE